MRYAILYPDANLGGIMKHKIKDKKYFFTGNSTIYAYLLIALAYIFAKHVLFYWSGWIVTAFCIAYIALAAAFMRSRGHIINREALYWLSCCIICAISYSIQDGMISVFARSLFLVLSSTYFLLLVVMKTPTKHNSEISDMLRAMLKDTFDSYFSIWKEAAAPFSAESSDERKSFFGQAFLGIVIAALLIAIVTPLLFQADLGSFAYLFDGLRGKFGSLFAIETIVACCLAVFIAPYWYGMHTSLAEQELVIKEEEQSRPLSPITVNIALGGLCVWYGIFWASQIQYVVSAVLGHLPNNAMSYSTFARRGFFELIIASAINLCAIGAVTRFSSESSIRKALIITISCYSLLFATASAAKMMLYISELGLTQLRVASSIFMLFLAICFIAVIANQIRPFRSMRFCAIAASIIIICLSVFNIDKGIVNYNTKRFLSGTIATYDMDILYNSGSAGIDGVKKVLSQNTRGDTNTYENALQYRNWIRSTTVEFQHRSLEYYSSRRKAH